MVDLWCEIILQSRIGFWNSWHGGCYIGGMKTEQSNDNAARVAGQDFVLNIGETLPAGAKFVRWTLTSGEEKPSNFSDIVEGYHPDYYFRDGKYIGADNAGVEPVWSVAKTAGMKSCA